MVVPELNDAESHMTATEFLDLAAREETTAERVAAATTITGGIVAVITIHFLRKRRSRRLRLLVELAELRAESKATASTSGKPMPGAA